MRRSDRKLNPSLKSQIDKTFAQLIADLKDLDEAYEFITDFFTESELETYSKRLATAYWLKKGRSYTNIKTNLKVSSATIAEVSSQQDTKGYKLAIKKMEAEEWANVWSEKIRKFTKRKN
jgi:TrpR-related protein YerC/YecD